MFQVLQLLIPALIPSWTFFQVIEASPRLQWRILDGPDRDAGIWQDHRPRPRKVSLPAMLRRLFWNPFWNDTLYLVSLAERLVLAPSDHSLRDIKRYIAADIARDPEYNPNHFLQFRVVFVHRTADQLVREVAYLSTPEPMASHRS